jgi:flavin-dependent dehydrogenase
MTQTFDALVIGGGPGGATAAILLARAGWAVALLERKEFPRRKVCGEYVSATNLPILEHLGIAEAFCEMAGPPVRRVGLFAGRSTFSSDLPRPVGQSPGWGRALGREHLDTLLLRRAALVGVDIRQPWSATRLTREGDWYCCRIQSRAGGTQAELKTGVIIAAHGSWDPGELPTQAAHKFARPSDLFGFKAHFHNAQLPDGLMPLLVFAGGYGGMVHTDAGRVSLSCCIRRDLLVKLRRQTSSDTAGETVLEYILEACLGVRQALAGATRQGAWLSAGPIRPGIRPAGSPGMFRVGNCAGEAHPVIAEGISMAMQGGWLLARHLGRWRRTAAWSSVVGQIRQDYGHAWRRAFAPRIHAAAVVANWAMRPAAVAGTLPLLRWFPALLTLGARVSGKATRVSSGTKLVRKDRSS